MTAEIVMDPIPPGEDRGRPLATWRRNDGWGQRRLRALVTPRGTAWHEMERQCHEDHWAGHRSLTCRYTCAKARSRGVLNGRGVARTRLVADRGAARSQARARLVVTLGENGALVVPAAARSAVHIAPPPAPIRDTTGAGDCFCGALAVLLADGADLMQASRLAVAAGPSRPRQQAREGSRRPAMRSRRWLPALIPGSSPPRDNALTLT